MRAYAEPMLRLELAHERALPSPSSAWPVPAPNLVSYPRDSTQDEHLYPRVVLEIPSPLVSRFALDTIHPY